MGEKTVLLTAFREAESNTGSAQDGSGAYSFEIEIPTVSCKIGEKSAFLMPNWLWYEEIGKETFLQLSLPNGWQGQAMLGESAIPQNTEQSFEIGNYLYSGARFGKSAELWLSLTGDGKKSEHLFLSDLCFEPAFSEPPLELTEEQVMWLPESKYFGGRDPRFRVKISGCEDSFSLGLERKDLLSTDSLKNGKYHYQVYLQRGSIFSRGQEKMFYESDFVIGGENYTRFEGVELVLKNAIYWEIQTEELVTKEAEHGAGILTDLEYVGDSVPSGESLALPKYQAIMCFETYDGRRIPFCADEDSSRYELINPVSVWIVNERNMILQNPDEAGLDFDIGAARLISKRRDLTMTRAMQEKRIKTPDYYGYEMRKSRNV